MIRLVALGGDEDDDFEQVGGAVGTDEQPSVGIFADVVDDDAVFDRVD